MVTRLANLRHLLVSLRAVQDKARADFVTDGAWHDAYEAAGEPDWYLAWVSIQLQRLPYRVAL